uniref:Uncharacterized protein n=1 Tax=Caenorhabditis japonica TaxID=281687 RepID=A0A8R1DQV1_CAEJA
MRSLFYFALLVSTRIAFADETEEKKCEAIESRFTSELNEHKQPVCTCAENGLFSRNSGMAIECESASLISISENLASLNGTELGSLLIRDSTINVLPNDVFENINSRHLRLERCGLSTISPNIFTPSLGETLESVSFRENRLKTIVSEQFKSLPKLKLIDLSANKIIAIEKNAFKKMVNVEELLLNGNELEVLEADDFEGMKSLKKLNLEGCMIKRIEKGAFRGLSSLEQLILTGNQLETLDSTVFAGLKNLRVLELGGNQLTAVEIKSLPKLEKLVLNNNQIETMKSVKLKDLPSLVVAMMDRNNIRVVGDMDMVGLIKSEKLATVSFAYNNISVFGSKAFQHIPNLINLLMNNNQLSELSNNLTPFLAPLKNLVTLQVSSNNLTIIRSGELPKSLVNLAVDHNAIERIEPRALEGIALKRLYLNSNKLQFLYQGAFDSFPPSTVEAIDVSLNSWQCVCKDPKEWLPRWLSEAEESDVSEGPIGCLAIPGCGMGGESHEFEEEEEQGRAGWITIAATVLTVITIVIMATIGIIYFRDYRLQFNLRGRRSYSDLHKLIENDPPKSDSIFVVPPMPKRNGAPKKTVRFENF